TTIRARDNGRFSRDNDASRQQTQTFGRKPSTKKKEQANPIKQKAGRPTIVNHRPSSSFQADNTDKIETGMEVEHTKFGFGKVLNTEGNPKNRMATIFFQKAGEKKIMLNYARLMIVKKQA